MATLRTLTVDAGKLRGALTVKLTLKGLRPTKARLWAMMKLIHLARFVGGCRVEAETAWDDDATKAALVVE